MRRGMNPHRWKSRRARERARATTLGGNLARIFYSPVAEYQACRDSCCKGWVQVGTCSSTGRETRAVPWLRFQVTGYPRLCILLAGMRSLGERILAPGAVKMGSVCISLCMRRALGRSVAGCRKFKTRSGLERLQTAREGAVLLFVGRTRPSITAQMTVMKSFSRS